MTSLDAPAMARPERGGKRALALPKPILLWAPPRSTSTAFECAVMQHPNVAVFHEQLADCFYFGENRKDKELPPAIESSKLNRETTYVSQLGQVVGGAAAGGKHFAFSKELSIYYQAEHLPAEMMREYTHCFLIREPEKVVRSFLRVGAKERTSTGASSTYFDPEEMGFAELEALYTLVTSTLGQAAVIVDSADLLAAPEPMLHKWCDAVGLPFDAAMVTWKPSEPKTWDKWPGWHDDAAASSGFTMKNHADAEEPLSEEAKAAVEMCQPIYDKLHAMRLTVDAKKD